MNETKRILESKQWHERPVSYIEPSIAFQAAVLVPILEVKGEPSLLFEVRSASLRRQPNEICFPGGKIERDDENPKETVLREVEEELCISRHDLEILGPLDIIKTPIGGKIYPYVGTLQLTQLPSFSKEEVDELFTVPLSWFLQHEPYAVRMKAGTYPSEEFPFHKLPYYDKNWKIRYEYSVWFYEYNQRVIWGLTAGIVKNFIEIYRQIGYNK